jgi:hypothetical protein
MGAAYHNKILLHGYGDSVLEVENEVTSGRLSWRDAKIVSR